ncbi:hypothetical protein ACFV5J_38660 [Streptomyces zaomyceticus]|uniref:hypothetical protein n=1 Tax=Streptomyces zaomyceticus TaxID=68286 RepID=UPI003669940D
MSSSQAPTPTPLRAQEPEPSRSTLLHRAATVVLGLLLVAYVLHEHPAVRETASAVATVAAVGVAALPCLRRR